ncbi:mitogen-activated protein kinase-binding protein [Plakobranchus ocellatus]|uniref:Mitogen-activated protein kinase-binding protein n=1 Tax=Plakobranchus ocellatus TaxID=259542 RepID=A0AAV4DD83_9GAST|nr:mitogen-activated protein kinase-binding protein [Plakobranchus ocellatus]
MACKLSELAERGDPSYLDDKRAASQDEFVLERVQGLTSTTLHSLASNPVTGWVSFPAACVLVLLDPKTNEQKFIESPSLKNISCCAFTDDGRFVAFSETGMKPHIAIWNLREHKECYKFVADTSIRAIFFHPTYPNIISLGEKESLIVVWDYIKGMRMAACKWQTMPLSLTIPKTGTSLVVCGHRKITLFNISKVNSTSHETNVFEDRKTVLLGKQSEYTFVDVVSGRGKHERTVYTVTSCGYVCEVKLGDILIDKAIKVDTQAFCVRYNTELLFVGCSAGVVKICDPDNLTVTAAVSLSSLLGPSVMPKVGSKVYLDVCTLVVDENEKIVTCVYADCSMHSWQIGTDGEKIVCSALEPVAGTSGAVGYPSSKSNLLRAFIGCCEKNKGGSDFFNKFSMTEQSRPPMQYGGRRVVNENRAWYQNVNAVRFTPDGKDVICGNEEGEIKVYELSTGILRRVIEAHSSQVTCIELMYDDEFQLVCSGGRDRVMFVLNARNDFSLVQVLCDHSAAITAISLVNNKGVLTLVSAAADNVVLIRRAILGGTLRFTITGEISQTNCNRFFFVTSDYIALGGKDCQIKVFKADPVFVSKPVKTINCQKLSPSNVGFKAIDIDPSSSFMAVSQANGNISVYHLQTGQPVASLPLQSDIYSIQFTADLKYMVSSTSNGCDLVWRLPERMTEFMRAKQEKTYQIETNKEVTYETYMSCVKVCKESEDDEESSDQHSNKPPDQDRPALLHQRRTSSGSQQRNNPKRPHHVDGEGIHHGHVAQNSSNHNSEWDRTPSIDSISILDNYNSSPVVQESMCVDGETGNKIEEHERGRRSCSTCYSESVLSCSMCTHSVSTTTHTSCCSVAASYSTTSIPDGGHARTGEGHNLRFYCGDNHELFNQVIEESQCIKIGPFREKCQQEDCNKRVAKKTALVEDHKLSSDEKQTGFNSLNHKQAGAGEQREVDEMNNEKVVAASLRKTCTEAVNSLKGRGGTKSDGMLKIRNEVMSETDNLNCDVKRTEHRHLSDLRLQAPHDVSQNSDSNNFAGPRLHESRCPLSKKILEKASFYEGLMKSGLRSFRRITTNSPTRQHTAAVKDAVRSLSQRRSGAQHRVVSKERRSSSACCRKITDKCEDILKDWTPLTTPECSNTSSNITNLVPSCSSTHLDLCTSSRLIQGRGPRVRVETSFERIARDRRCSPSPNIDVSQALEFDVKQNLLDNDWVVKPYSEATHEESESFQTDFEEEMVSAEDFIPCLEVDNKVCCQEDQEDSRTTLFNCAAGENDKLPHQISPLNTFQTREEVEKKEREKEAQKESIIFNCEGNKKFEDIDLAVSSEVNELEEKLTSTLKSVHENEQTLKQGVVSEHQSVLAQLEQEGFTVPEKYHNALRSCMQLSNSQETFATLRVDTNDLELMAFLSHALKKKLVAVGLVGLSCNEIDKLLNTGVPSQGSGSSEEVEVKKPAEITETEHLDSLNECPVLQAKAENTIALADEKTESQKSHPTELGIRDHGRETGDPDTCHQAEKFGASEEEVCSGNEHGTNDPKLGLQEDRQRSPMGDIKRRMYKSIRNRLSHAKKSLRNRSSNKNSLESDSEQSFDYENKGLVQEGGRFGWCGDLSQINIYIKKESSSNENLFEQDSNKGLKKRVDANEHESIYENLSLTQNSHQYKEQKQGKGYTSPKGIEKKLEGHQVKTVSEQCSAMQAITEAEATRYNRRSRSSPVTFPTVVQCTVSEMQSKRPSSPQTMMTCEQAGEESVLSRAENLTSKVSKEMSSENHCSESDSGVEAESHKEKRIADIFLDQDEYLRKLKEVRENFERSIQALSEERKSRQAAEERERILVRK